MADEDITPCPPPPPGTVVSVIISRKAADVTTVATKGTSAGTVRLAVAARTPRKRISTNDKVRFTLRHFAFLDDRRRFTNLDTLLTRLAPVSVVHVGCTESAELSSRGSNQPAKSQSRRAREVSELLSKLTSIIDSRSDVLLPSVSSADTNLSNVIPTLPKNLSTTSATTSYVDPIMVHLLGGDASESHLSYRGDKRLNSDEPLAKRAIGLLLHAERTTADNDEDLGSYNIESAVLDSHLALDRTAAECINLLPPCNAGVAACLVGGDAGNNSIFGVLNQCKTRMGSRTLELWLRQPLIDYAEIIRRQGAVAKMVEDGVGRDRVRDEGLAPIAGVDLDNLAGRIGNAASVEGVNSSTCLEGLYKMYLFASQHLPNLIECLTDLVDENGIVVDRDNNHCALASSLGGLRRVQSDLTKSVQLVEAVLDFDEAPKNFQVKPTFDDTLVDIKRELEGVDMELEQAHSEMNELWAEMSGQSIGQVRLETGDPTGGNASTTTWQFRLPKTNDQKKLKEALGDRVNIHRILKNGVYFSTKHLRQLGTKKHDLLAEYDSCQREIVKNAMTIAGTYIPILERASSIVAELDVLGSLAYVAAYSPNGYCRPELTDGEEDGLGIELKDARHPCVELQEAVDYIPNDISLIYGSSSFLLVTGPNMGGKSTYIRSLGAIITMAQIGSYVPCTSAKINIVHHILARVGAGDVQDQGISTFMAEMLEASSILRTATKRSLIIIDELGRGTSTFDGFGLATAISEYIVQRLGCMTVFATHFHELTSLEEREKAVKNCHVTAQRSTDGSNGLTFLYEVRPGPCLESFGIQVAEMANVPHVVIADAKRKAKQLENFDYQKKRRRGDDEGGEQGGENGIDAHEDAEAAALAVEFVNNFRKIPFRSLNDEEKREALRSLCNE